jgi:hypothetical protein
MTRAESVRVCFSERSATGLFEVGGELLSPARMETFARGDGFESVEDMARFWWAEHPPEEGNRIAFEGVLIRWQPLVAVAEPQAA